MRRWLHLAATLLLAVAASDATASTLEKLLSPGELSAAHAKLESECSQCHDRSNQARQTPLCLDCHKDTAADLAAHRGLHGHALKAGDSCVACHTEHKGRHADIVRFDRDSFQHAITGFTLDGAHVTTGCPACHLPGKKFRAAATSCYGCHAQQDVHKKKLGEDCASCHTTTTFRKTNFDHDKTDFPLKAAHQRAACGDCHRDAAYKNTPTQCVACHSRDDVHKGMRGPACGNCHDTDRWKRSSFDHERVAHYALNGAHAKVACESCHLSGDLKAKVPDKCAGCHAADDRHGGRFGDACADCHTETRWKEATYDHALKAKFPLRDKHAKLACDACHVNPVGKPRLATSCHGCHEADDVHHGTMGKDCAACHRETGWRDQVRFDHDMTRFPLIGLHAGVACEECHVNRAYRSTARECAACHKAQDVHKEHLGKDCASCHNPNGWTFWQFDHGRSTKFALEGAHAKVACKTCHVKSADEVKLPTDCASCHTRDDVHHGGFGNDCSRCHSSIAWQGAGVRR